jgi:hypothetical protein
MMTLGKTSFAEERKPFKIDLQLFAEEDASDPGVGESAEPTEVVDSGTDPGSLEDVTESVNDDPIDDNEESTEVEQSPEVNAAFARMRRQLKKADDLIAKIYGEEFNISSIEELEALYNQMEQEHMQQQYQQTGQIDPNFINNIINNHPAIKAATQVAEDQRLISNFNELKKEYPELVKTADDIPPEVWDQYDKGISLVDAYTITNRKEILDFYKNVGKQKTLNNINSKKHLKTEGDGASSGEGVHIPAETLQMYLEMGMSKEEATAHYRKLYE